MRFQRFVFQTGIKLRLQTLLKRLRQTSQYSNRAFQQVAKSKFLLYIIQIRNLNLSFHISGSLPNHQVINSFGVTLALTFFVRASFLSKLLCVFRILCFFQESFFIGSSSTNSTRQLSVSKLGVSQVTLAASSKLLISGKARRFSGSYMSL